MVEEQLLTPNKAARANSHPAFQSATIGNSFLCFATHRQWRAGCRSPLTLHGRTRTGTPVDIESPSLESWIVESWLVMVETGVLLDAFTRVYESLHRILADLTAAELLRSRETIIS